MKHFTGVKLVRNILAGLFVVVVAACETGVPLSGDAADVDPTKPVAVALMVPYGSGDASNDQLADNLVNAARMAAADVRGAIIDIRVYNTGANPEFAAAEAQRAITEGAQVIVGPLFSSATSAVAPVAAAADVPVFSFSNNAAIAGGSVKILGLTFENVATRVLEHLGMQGIANVGVVYPQGLEGDAALAATTLAAVNTGTIISTSMSYPLSIEGLSEAAPIIAEALMAAEVQAVMLTDTPTRGLPFIAAALAAEELTEDDVQYVGLSRWDSSEDLLQQPSLQGGLFAVPDPVLNAQFEERYLTVYGEEPHALAALSYDAIAAIGALISTAAAEGATDTFSNERITNPSGFVGVNGIFRFLPSGQIERGLAILAVDSGSAVIVDPAPRSFGY